VRTKLASPMYLGSFHAFNEIHLSTLSVSCLSRTVASIPSSKALEIRVD
jgi:hypothetical protein